MRTRAIAVAVVLIASLWAVCPARADGVVRGRFEWSSASTLVFKDDRRAEQRIQVDPQARIMHNGRRISLNQLKSGWMLTIHFVDDKRYGRLAVKIESASLLGMAVGAGEIVVNPATISVKEDMPGLLD